MDIKRIFLIFFILILFSFSVNASEEKEPINDYLYSAEYFDYLIECAQIEKNKQEELESQKNNEITIETDEITPFEQNDLASIQEPFKLRIESDLNINPYGETFIEENSKTIIPVGDNFSFIQDAIKKRNKYASDEYRILAGAELKFLKYFNISSGLETNYRGLDQNPSSRKVYFSPGVNFNDKLSLTFHNKFNVSSKETDHDIGFNISPFKSKSMDFGVYTGITRNQAGKQTESVYFSTNFYFF